MAKRKRLGVGRFLPKYDNREGIIHHAKTSNPILFEIRYTQGKDAEAFYPISDHLWDERSLVLTTPHLIFNRKRNCFPRCRGCNFGLGIYGDKELWIDPGRDIGQLFVKVQCIGSLCFCPYLDVLQSLILFWSLNTRIQTEIWKKLGLRKRRGICKKKFEKRPSVEVREFSGLPNSRTDLVVRRLPVRELASWNFEVLSSVFR